MFPQVSVLNGGMDALVLDAEGLLEGNSKR